MLNNTLKTNPVAADRRKSESHNSYVAPGIEQLLTPDDLEREIHYAGGLTCPTCDRNNFT